MKVQTLNENLIAALGQIKENKVNICNVTLNRKLLLEALKVNKDFGLITLESGKRTWHELSSQGEYLTDRNVQDRPCLQISLDHTVMSFFHQDTFDFKCPNPAIIRFGPNGGIAGYPLDPQEFAAKLSKVLKCVATEETRPALRCVYFQADGENLKLTGCDGFRLLTTSILCQLPQSDFLIEREDIEKLIKFLKSATDIQIENASEQVNFNYKGGTMVCEKVDTKFPEYSKVIPTEGNTIEFYSKDMLEAVKALKSYSHDGTNVIRLKFTSGETAVAPGKCLLSAKNYDDDGSETTIDCKVQADCRIALQSSYLIAYLKSVKGIIKAKIRSEMFAMVCEFEGATYVQMPMQTQWDDKPKEQAKEQEPQDGEELSDEPEDLETNLVESLDNEE